MKQMLVYFFAALFFSSCAGHPPKTQMTFIDAKLFDQNLSDSMSAESQKITVNMVGNVSINNMPERMSKWLGAVADKRGRVTVMAAAKDGSEASYTKSLTLIVGILPTIYDWLKKELWYGAAMSYDAKVIYDPDTGQVNKVEFTKKKEFR